MDIFHPFVMDMSIQALPRTVTPGDGSEILQDLSNSPEVSVSGQTRTQVSIIIISPVATLFVHVWVRILAAVLTTNLYERIHMTHVVI